MEVENQRMGGKPGSAFTQSTPRISNEVFKKPYFPNKKRGCDSSSEMGQGDEVSTGKTSSDRSSFFLPLGVSLRGRERLMKWVCSQFGSDPPAVASDNSLFTVNR